MRRHFQLFTFVVVNALAFEAAARGTIRLNSCIVTWGGFCPIETIGGAIAAIGALFVIGFPFRMYGEREFKAGRAENDEARMKRGIFLIKWSTYLGVAVVVLVVFILIS